MTSRPRYIAHLRLHAVRDDDRYADALDLLTGITPHVRAVAPDAVQLDLTSALRYFGRGPRELVGTAKLRLMGLYGVESSAGLADNRMVATMAADESAPGQTTWVPAGEAAAWLRPRPVAALPGTGRTTAAVLGRYGLHTIGQVADLPAETLQRLLGAGRARLLAERARGHDPRPVVPPERAVRPGPVRPIPVDPERPARHLAMLSGPEAGVLSGPGPGSPGYIRSIDNADAPPRDASPWPERHGGYPLHRPPRADPRRPTGQGLVADLVLDRDCLDPVWHHRAVLGLADRIGQCLRGEGQVARRLTLTVRYADGGSTTRTRPLTEPTDHSPALVTAALDLLAALGLQRARVRAFVIRADGLLPARGAYRQLSLDPGDDRARAAEAAADRARRRFGPEAVRPAALAGDRHHGQGGGAYGLRRPGVFTDA
ncbi:DNA polymerase Y family protein [Streptomyces lushanensis]|uniref:DNA polymerase Y family protein n=1 Tax=Streptomyces lushanensis TaxID=1434255 RepID=UPI000A7E4878|nr:ImpB/MucB/SamB family protein [Streptomyces lushanensis]